MGGVMMVYALILFLPNLLLVVGALGLIVYTLWKYNSNRVLSGLDLLFSLSFVGDEPRIVCPKPRRLRKCQ